MAGRQHVARVRPRPLRYTRSDEAVARALVEALQAKGADVWWDEDSITFGQPLSTSLESAVGGSGCLFVIASEAAADSTYVQLEVDAAVAGGLPITPVLLAAELPAAWWPKLTAGSPGIASPIIGAVTAPADAHAHALTRLELDPVDRRRWLTADSYEALADALRTAREASALRPHDGRRVRRGSNLLRRVLGAFPSETGSGGAADDRRRRPTLQS